MKVFVQSKNDAPFSPTAQIAALGFAQRGWEVRLAKTLPEISPEIPLVGSVSWTERALATLGVTLAGDDYPEALHDFLKRPMNTGVLGPLLLDSSLWPVFVKPLKQKEFPGTVLRNEEDVAKFAKVPLATPVWFSPLLEIGTEYRVYVLQGQVLASCLYLGSGRNFPHNKVVGDMIRKFKNAPQSYCLDVGVLASNETILIEMTEILAASNYGLPPYLHSQMIEVRWAELTGGIVPEFHYEDTPPFLMR